MYTCILLTEKIKCIFYLLCCHCLSKTQNHTTLHMSGKRNQSIDRKWGGRGAFKTCLKVDSLGRSRVQSCTLGTSSVVLLLDRCWLHGQLAGLAQRAKLPKEGKSRQGTHDHCGQYNERLQLVRKLYQLMVGSFLGEMLEEPRPNKHRTAARFNMYGPGAILCTNTFEMFSSHSLLFLPSFPLETEELILAYFM